MSVGTVKWFDADEGNGFIAGKDGQDIWVSYTAIQGQGYWLPAQGSQVEFDVVQDPLGPRAYNVRAVSAQRSDDPSGAARKRQYVLQCRAQGQTDAAIAAALARAGWPEAEVRAALSADDQSTAPPQEAALLARDRALKHIRTCRANGQPDQTIGQALAGAGWQQRDIGPLLAAPGGQPPQPQTMPPLCTVDMALVHRGHQHRAAGNIEMALRAYTEAIENAQWPDPDLAQAYAGRAEARRSQQDGTGAAEDWASAFVCEAEAARRTGRYQDALRALASADALPGILPYTRALTLHARSRLHRDLGEYAAAIADCTGILALRFRRSADDPPDQGEEDERADALSDRAETYYQLGEHDAAIADVTDAILLRRQDKLLHEQRSRYHECRGDVAHALADLDVAVRIAPDDPLIHISRAWFHLSQEHYPEALADWRQAGQLVLRHPDAQTSLNCLASLEGLTKIIEQWEVVLAAGDTGALQMVEHLMRLDPIEFERLVGRIWERLGYAVRITPASGDEGIDVVASREDTLNAEWIAVQCKRYGQPVGRPAAQALVGAINADTRYTRGILVGVSGFTQQCIEYARQQGRLELWDGAMVCQKLAELGIVWQG